jgi:hypothetical protein
VLAHHSQRQGVHPLWGTSSSSSSSSSSNLQGVRRLWGISLNSSNSSNLQRVLYRLLGHRGFQSSRHLRSHKQRHGPYRLPVMSAHSGEANGLVRRRSLLRRMGLALVVLL